MAGTSNGFRRMVIIGSVAAITMIVLVAALGIGSYFFFAREESEKSVATSKKQTIGDQLKQASRKLTGTTTDAAKITSVSFASWSHGGPMYPPPSDPPGYVLSSSVDFRRDLTARRETKKDYDRDSPDEVSTQSATLTAEQFEKLAGICAESDIVNEPDSKEVISEGGTTLTIEYNGEKKSIVTSNAGQDTVKAANVLNAIKELEKSVNWVTKKP